jgi:hypothetical protein
LKYKKALDFSTFNFPCSFLAVEKSQNALDFSTFNFPAKKWLQPTPMPHCMPSSIIMCLRHDHSHRAQT